MDARPSTTPASANAAGTEEDLRRLFREALDLLEGFDRAGLHQAGAHLSLAIESMLQRHSDLAKFD